MRNLKWRQEKLGKRSIRNRKMRDHKQEIERHETAEGEKRNREKDK